MSETSAKPILVAGAVGTVVLLGIAWIFTAATSNQAVVNAEKYAEMKAMERAADPIVAEIGEAEADQSAEAEVVEAEAEKPAETEVAEAEAEKPAETEVAEAEAEKPAETEAAEAEAEKPAEAEVAEAEAEKPAETEAAEAEAEKPAETEVAEAEAEKPAETEVAEAEAEKPAETEAAAAEPEVAAAATAAAAPAAVETASLDGDAKAGAKVFRKCKACHKIGEGAKSAVGPYLTDIVGRVQGSVEGFKYSDGFQTAMAEGKTWTPAELDAFLLKPKDYMKGTKMAFGGLRKDKDRANVIAYLATNGE